MNHFTKKKFIERFLDMIIILIFSPRNLLCFEKFMLLFWHVIIASNICLKMPCKKDKNKLICKQQKKGLNRKLV